MFNRKVSAAITVLLVALVTIALVASALPVFASSAAAALPAHAQLLSTTPKDGASVATAKAVTMTFSEDVNEEFLQVEVEGPDGAESDGKPTVDGPTVTQPLAADLPAGKHEVTFRVVSVDGHPVSGSVTFTTTRAAASPSPTATPTPTESASPTATASATPAPTETPATSPASSEEGSTPWAAIVIGLVIGLLVGGVLVRVVLARAARRGGPPPTSG